MSEMNCTCSGPNPNCPRGVTKRFWEICSGNCPIEWPCPEKMRKALWFGGNFPELEPRGSSRRESSLELGDLVESILSKFGITKERVRRWLGDCGCAERQEKLNDLSRTAKIVSKLLLTGKFKEAKHYIETLFGGEEEMSVTWSYGVMTVPARSKTTLPKTLESLKVAGFDKPHLFIDGPAIMEYTSGLGVTSRYPNIRIHGNWLLSIYELYIRYPEADRFALFQDDILVYKNLRQYLDRCKYPTPGYWNLHTFKENYHLAVYDANGNQRPQELKGWYESNQLGKSAVALVFDRDALFTLLQSKFMLERPLNSSWGWRNVDGGIINSLSRHGKHKEYVHNPSLVQHMDGHESTFKQLDPSILQRYEPSPCWRGEEFDATELIKECL